MVKHLAGCVAVLFFGSTPGSAWAGATTYRGAGTLPSGQLIVYDGNTYINAAFYPIFMQDGSVQIWAKWYTQQATDAGQENCIAVNVFPLATATVNGSTITVNFTGTGDCWGAWSGSTVPTSWTGQFVAGPVGPAAGATVTDTSGNSTKTTSYICDANGGMCVTKESYVGGVTRSSSSFTGNVGQLGVSDRDALWTVQKGAMSLSVTTP